MAKAEHLRTAKLTLIRGLETTERLLDGFPIPGVKGTIGAALDIIREAERTITNAKLCNELKEHITRLETQLRPLAAKTEDEIPDQTRAAVKDYMKQIGLGLQQLKHPEMRKYGEFLRWIHSKEIEGDIRMVMESIRLNTDSFMVASSLRIELAQHQQGSAIQSAAQDNRRENALKELLHAPEATLDSKVQPRDNHGKLLLCLEGTRVTILNKIMNWFKDPISPPIFWLHGLAGTGKSTIARTIGVKAKDAGYTTASFFFSRTGAEGRRDPSCVFPTLARQLAASHSKLRQIIGDAATTLDINTVSASIQFKTLIEDPLCAFSEGAGDILIVLDALDECEGVKDNRTQEILTCLREHDYQAGPRLRILLTSRRENHLHHVLAHQPQVVEHDLNGADDSAQEDIARCLQAGLSLIQEKWKIRVEDWPQKEDVEMLLKMSGRLFIFTDTVLRFIGDNQSNPRDQMNILLGMDQTTINAYTTLDTLYHRVLENALPPNRDDISLRFRQVVGCIILSKDTLPVSVIAKIAECRVDQVMTTLLQLQSVMVCSSLPGIVGQQDSDLLPRPYHPSFPDYLVDSKRCSDSRFIIVKPKMHGFIVLRCFELMKPVLQRNILELHDLYIRNEDIPDLKARLRSRITPDVAYACQFWPSHLLESEADKSILGALYGFLSKQFLWWCEALSLLDSAHGGQGHLLATVAFRLQNVWEQMAKASCDQEIVDLLNDTYRFLFSHGETISQSAMYTYHSALPFTPRATRLYGLYKPENSDTITVLQGLGPTWTPCLSSRLIGRLVATIESVSPDGTRLAVNDCFSISILDTRTTTLQCRIPDIGGNSLFALSPSEGTLATVGDNRLELWNTTTGSNKKNKPLSGTHFYAMAFSSRGKYLLLAIDHGLCLHDGTEAGELSVLPTNWRHRKIIFTSDDTQVITGSKEGYIHFFKLSGTQLSEIQERRIFNESKVLGLVLRQDSKRLVSSGKDRTIRIYDLLSRSPIATLRWPESERSISAIAYHPMEEELAVGQGDCLVLWRQKETPSDWMPSIHSTQRASITAIAYCENGTRMYTTTTSGDITLWENTTTTTQVPGLHKHGGSIQCYAVSHSASLLATGSATRAPSIILWNLTTGDYLRRLVNHMWLINTLTFSDDGVLLASGCSQTTIVWDVETGSPLHKWGTPRIWSYPLVFSKDRAHLTARTANASFVWELESGGLVERQQLVERETRTSHDTTPTGPYHFVDINGWQTVVEVSSWNKKCILCRLPGEYRDMTNPFHAQKSPIFGDRAALFCEDGKVVILDISRVKHVFMNPTQQISPGWQREFANTDGQHMHGC